MEPPISVADVDLDQFLRMSMDLFVVAADGYFQWVNPTWEKVLGWSEAELLATPFLDLIHPQDVEATVGVLATIQPGESIAGFRNRYRTKSGDYRWLEWNSARHEDGRWYCNVRDVTRAHRKALERQTREHLLQMASEVGRTGHWLVNLVDDTVFWSDEVYRIHGLDPETHTPDVASGIEAYHEADRERVQQCLERAIAEHAPFEFECRLMRPDGTQRLVQSLGRPQIDPRTNEVVGIFGVFRDLTDDDRSRRHEELQQFAYVAAHDLRQPANTVQSFVPLLLASLDEPSPEQEQIAGFIQDAAQRMGQLITDLKTYAVSGAGAEMHTVSVNEQIDAVLRDVHSDIETDGGAIQVEPLPPVIGNATLLRQVIQNLLTNASRFRSPDRPLRLHIGAEVEGDRATIVVSDNGVGFDNAHVGYIFEPFKRLNTQRDGSGLGLAIARRMVSQCGGTLRAHGEVGVGATFRFDLAVA